MPKYKYEFKPTTEEPYGWLSPELRGTLAPTIERITENDRKKAEAKQRAAEKKAFMGNTKKPNLAQSTVKAVKNLPRNMDEIAENTMANLGVLSPANWIATEASALDAGLGLIPGYQRDYDRIYLPTDKDNPRLSGISRVGGLFRGNPTVDEVAGVAADFTMPGVFEYAMASAPRVARGLNALERGVSKIGRRTTKVPSQGFVPTATEPVLDFAHKYSSFSEKAPKGNANTLARQNAIEQSLKEPLLASQATYEMPLHPYETEMLIRHLTRSPNGFVNRPKRPRNLGSQGDFSPTVLSELGETKSSFEGANSSNILPDGSTLTDYLNMRDNSGNSLYPKTQRLLNRLQARQKKSRMWRTQANDIGDIKIYSYYDPFSNTGASYNRQENTVEINTAHAKNVDDDLVHEIEHAIQMRVENFDWLEDGDLGVPGMSLEKAQNYQDRSRSGEKFGKRFEHATGLYANIPPTFSTLEPLANTAYLKSAYNWDSKNLPSTAEFMYRVVTDPEAADIMALFKVPGLITDYDAFVKYLLNTSTMLAPGALILPQLIDINDSPNTTNNN